MEAGDVHLRPAARQSWGVTGRPVVVGLIGGVLTAGIVLTALVGAARVAAAHRAVSKLESIQRHQQDADMMREGLRSDVLNAVLTGSGSGIDSPEEIREDVAADAARLRADLLAIERLDSRGSPDHSLRTTLRALEEYAAQAEIIVRAALVDPVAAQAYFASFDETFHRLEVLQAMDASALALAARRAHDRAQDEETAVERELLVLSTIGVAGFFGLAFALSLLGRRAASSSEELQARDRRFAALVENSSDMITVVDADGFIVYDSPSRERVMGYGPGERVGTQVLDYVHPDDRGVARARFAGETPTAEVPPTDEVRLRHKDGSWRWVEGVWSNLLDVPEVAGIVVNWREVSERKAMEDRLFGEREFLAAVLENLEDGVVACDAVGVLTLFNGATRRLHGLPEEPLPAEKWAQHYDLFLPDQTSPMRMEDLPLFRALSGEVVRNAEIVIGPMNGRRRSVQASGRAIFGGDGAKVGAVVTLHDTTERRCAERELLRQAFQDPLTGLGNRASLAAHLEAALRRAAGTGLPLALLIVDLDDFKKVNDSLGRTAGDLLLVEIANRLRECLHGADVAVRLDGDEFGLVLEEVSGEQAILVADRILAATRASCALGGGEVRLDASIGIALSGWGNDGGDRLLRAADLALCLAKSRGKGRHALFEPNMGLAALGRLTLEADLRRAHAGGLLTLAYQPVVSLSTGVMVGVEALLRWHPPGQSPVRPDEFIPVAEDSGLIVPIGAWVLLEACAQARRWDEAHPDRAPLTVAVNVSPKQLQRGDLINLLEEVLERTGLQPGRLVLEITEGTLMGDDDVAMTMLREIDRLGVKLSIDDFGTGYSSLSRLRTLPISVVKIDQSFVNDIDGPDAVAPLVVATLAMARGLGMSVVAEGIETIDQLGFLCRHGCPDAQGFLMSRPVEASAISTLLDRQVPLVDIHQEPRRLDGPANRQLMAAVEAVVTAHESHEEAILPLLTQMARVSGLESTYLTESHLGRCEQEIRHAHNSADLEIPEGLMVEWANTLCPEALLGGPSDAHKVCVTYPDTAATRQLGLQTFVSVPVPAPDGRIFGTLCGASTNRRELGDTEMAVFHLFARLIADKLAQGDTHIPPPERAPRLARANSSPRNARGLSA